MDLPMRTQINPEGLRSEEAHIYQEGSRFGNTHVSGGIALQGNFAGGVTKRFLTSLIHRIILTTSRLHSATDQDTAA